MNKIRLGDILEFIKHSCGHGEYHDMEYSVTDTEHLSAHICSVCWIKASYKIRDKSVQYVLLSGSQRQKAWAEAIRARIVGEILLVPCMSQWWRPVDQAQFLVLEYTDASWWITHKNMTGKRAYDLAIVLQRI